MLILLSPTKQMSLSSRPLAEALLTEPRFLHEAQELSERLRKISKQELSILMGMSEKLTEETYSLIQKFGMKNSSTGAAWLSYSGTVFQHMDPQTLGNDAWDYAFSHLGILSGLYGFLRPTDRIYPYRLEMKTSLGLYDFWRDKLTSVLVERDCPILNLASSEYSKVINWKQIKKPALTLQFKEEKEGRLRTVGMYSKMARGKMARMVIMNKLTEWDNIKNWNVGGYLFNETESSDRQWIFSGKWSG
jgi:cytoplasmic iron level regulating protein YaaA (DUF328/UPF0246 family)